MFGWFGDARAGRNAACSAASILIASGNPQGFGLFEVAQSHTVAHRLSASFTVPAHQNSHMSRVVNAGLEGETGAGRRRWSREPRYRGC